ncbi:ubiquinone biosynthesis protein [Variovorax sp. PAMC26660]|uniref:ubiquinone biosynthesis protein n=1 Tax=Variovorax sp. PAMC26660 TaxID=2762322 RepID=UPI00164D785C|nr:ubiquinone biosynthesis protein [Variovorax sp. PAMC26660]QNK66418.1 ubiquinone biosynthesis protein [Variovorax sp. PAMC26660]
MGDFIGAVTGYPTAIYTVLLGVVVIYWALAVLGMIDIGHSGIDLHVEAPHVHVDAPTVHAHADTDSHDIGHIASYVVAFGLNGVPFSVAVSLLVLVSWTVCCLGGEWLLPLVPTMPLKLLAGTVLLVASAVIAIPVTAVAIRPLHGLFVSHTAVTNAALVGQLCRVVTGAVNEKDGRAEVARRGASLNIRVWAPVPNTLKRGSQALIIEYDEVAARYLIAPHDDTV